MKKLFTILIIAVLAFSLFGCQKTVVEEETKPLNPREITVTDSEGNTVTTSAENNKIVSVGYNATSLVIALGGKLNLVACEEQTDDRPLLIKAFADIETMPKITENGSVNVDKIVELAPSLVVLTTDYKDAREALTAKGITVAVVNCNDFTEIKSSITLVGQLINCDERATRLTSYYDATLTRVKAMTLTETPKTLAVYNEDEGLTTLTSNMNVIIDSEGEYLIGKVSDNPPKNAVTCENAIEPWDEPSPAMANAVTWYTAKLFPDSYNAEDAKTEILHYYSEFYKLNLKAEDLGLSE